MKKLSLGIIGYTKENGNPYLWPSIFNGFDAGLMADCPFEGVAKTLAKRNYPMDFLSSEATVEHIWTPNRGLSDLISKTCNIPYIAEDYTDMVGRADAILLARGDAENHLEYARPFIKAGIPIFIHKPLAKTREGARKLLGLEQYEGQIFSCSPLRYAQELQLTEAQLESLGNILMIDAFTPGEWNQNAVDIIEPLVELIGRENFVEVNRHKITTGNVQRLALHLENGMAISFSALGGGKYPLMFRIVGTERSLELVYQDSFIANRKH